MDLATIASATVVATCVSVAALRFVAMTWVKNLAMKELEDHKAGLQEQLVTHKSNLQTQQATELATYRAELQREQQAELEKLKADLRVATAERELRFNRLHEKRIDVLAELSEHLATTDRTLAALVSISASPRQDEMLKRLEPFGAAFQSFASSYDRWRAFLPEECCTRLDGFATKARDISIDYQVGAGAGDFTMVRQAWKDAELVLGPARTELEGYLRTLIGT